MSSQTEAVNDGEECREKCGEQYHARCSRGRLVVFWPVGGILASGCVGTCERPSYLTLYIDPDSGLSVGSAGWPDAWNLFISGRPSHRQANGSAAHYGPWHKSVGAQLSAVLRCPSVLGRCRRNTCRFSFSSGGRTSLSSYVL